MKSPIQQRSARSSRIRPWGFFPGAAGFLLALWALVPGVVQAAGASGGEAIESAFDAVLAPVVGDGWVDYPALVAEPEPLDRWLDRIAQIDWKEVRKWPRYSQIAFYINAYNGNVLRIVRDHYPIQGENPAFPPNSIQQIQGVWDLPFTVGGQELTLNEIEKTILLGDYGEFRVHFGLNCASAGCPILRPEAYHGETLIKELNLAAQMFIRGERGSRLDLKAKTVALSPLFDWYRKDFAHLAGVRPVLQANFDTLAPVLAYVASHHTLDEWHFMQDGDYKVSFLDYDWSLNDRPKR